MIPLNNLETKPSFRKKKNAATLPTTRLIACRGDIGGEKVQGGI